MSWQETREHRPAICMENRCTHYVQSMSNSSWPKPQLSLSEVYHTLMQVMNGIIGGVSRCQRFIHSLAAIHTSVHKGGIVYNIYRQRQRMCTKLANALSREIQLIATPDIGGFIQPERLLLMILVTTTGRWIE